MLISIIKKGEGMKDIARMALEPGMEIAVDVYNYKNELIVPAGAKVDNNIISKLTRHSIICVTVMESIDYAVTYFEKVHLNKNFLEFRDAYLTAMPKYKEMMHNFVFERISFDMDELFKIYHDIYSSLDKGELLIGYLYNMLPTEDDFTYAHCLNSALIAGLFASWFSLSEEETTLLIQCAFFYDVGKLKLPSELIWNPGKLSVLEFEQIKTHTILGFQLLQDVPGLNTHVLKAALMHHERADGSGYPSKLHDTQIDIYARYISIIDSYEAMTSARTYRQSKNPFEVISIFEKDAFKYDPALLRPVLYRLSNLLVGLSVILSDDQVAEVILINQSLMGRPLLRTKDGVFIDLVARKDLTIKGIY